MYEAFFGFSQRPFAAAPSANRYFPASSCDAARTMLARCLERADGPGLLIGPTGTGKTLLLAVLAEQFGERFSVATLTGGRITTRKALLQAILFELGRPYQGLDEGELRLGLTDYLTRSMECPEGMLLLVDEAHSLSVRLLEELRMITNLMRGSQPRVRLVLAGSSALEEHFTHPKLDSFNQRVAARCYLETFDQAETADFVRFELAIAGGHGEVFTHDGLVAVHRATDGIPRLINQLCDQSLMRAFADQDRHVNAGLVEQAWSDLQQLPTPWNDELPQGSTSVVEFGALSDDDDQPAAFEMIQPPIPEQYAAEEQLPEQYELDLDAWATEEPSEPASSSHEFDEVTNSFELDLDNLQPVESVAETDETTDSPNNQPVAEETPVELVSDAVDRVEYEPAETLQVEPFTVEPDENEPIANEPFEAEQCTVAETASSDLDDGYTYEEEVLHDRYAALDASAVEATASLNSPSDEPHDTPNDPELEVTYAEDSLAVVVNPYAGLFSDVEETESCDSFDSATDTTHQDRPVFANDSTELSQANTCSASVGDGDESATSHGALQTSTLDAAPILTGEPDQVRHLTKSLDEAMDRVDAFRDELAEEVVQDPYASLDARRTPQPELNANQADEPIEDEAATLEPAEPQAVDDRAAETEQEELEVASAPAEPPRDAGRGMETTLSLAEAILRRAQDEDSGSSPVLAPQRSAQADKAASVQLHIADEESVDETPVDEEPVEAEATGLNDSVSNDSVSNDSGLNDSGLNDSVECSAKVVTEAEATASDSAHSESSPESTQGEGLATDYQNPDEDLIVVEEETAEVPTSETHPVRRQDYRQLFARLRRG